MACCLLGIMTSDGKASNRCKSVEDMANTVICLVVAVNKDDVCKELKQSFGVDCKVYKLNDRVSFARVEATTHSYGLVESLKGDSKMHWFCPETGDDSGMFHVVNAQLEGLFSDELMGH